MGVLLWRFWRVLYQLKKDIAAEQVGLFLLIVIAFIDCLYEHVRGNISLELSGNFSFVGL